LAIRQSVRKPCFSLAGFPPGLLPKLNGILQGRGQTAEEIARAALFLCSHQSSAMTGQSINVDGGMAFS
jgi:NAD(P)-dependent dehydrogenase (short-subunit alcohol dehydrogenase family)